MTPLGREHDEVERADRLDLAPRRPAPSRLVRRVERLHHHAFVPGRERVGERSPPRRRRRRSAAQGTRQRPTTPSRTALRSSQREVEQVAAVDVQAVEEERVNRDPMLVDGFAGVGLGAAVPNRLIVSWKRRGRASSVSPIASPSSTNACAGNVRAAADDLGQTVGDVVEVAREHAHVVAGAVHLDARAVELPLDRRGPGCGERVGDVLRRSRRASGAPAAALRAVLRRARPRRPRAHVRRSRRGRRRASPPGAPQRPARPRPRAIASAITPASAPWRSSPMNRRAMKSASSAVARAEELGEHAPGAPPADPAPVVACTVLIAASRSESVSVGVAAGAAVARASRSVAQPTPIRPWRGSPTRKPTVGTISSAASAAQQLRERVDLRVPGAGRADHRRHCDHSARSTCAFSRSGGET